MTGSKRLLVGLPLALALLGCGPPDGQRPTAPVEVTVTYKGTAVSGATVTFVTMEKPPLIANGISNDQGVAVMTTYVPKDGAAIGRHTVTVAKVEVDPAKTKTVVDPTQADVVGYTPLTPLKSFLPKKYSLPGTSGIEVEVQKGSNNFPLQLED